MRLALRHQDLHHRLLKEIFNALTNLGAMLLHIGNDIGPGRVGILLEIFSGLISRFHKSSPESSFCWSVRLRSFAKRFNSDTTCSRSSEVIDMATSRLIVALGLNTENSNRRCA
jgi:hypothetical protein